MLQRLFNEKIPPGEIFGEMETDYVPVNYYSENKEECEGD
ncbi:hypothetical protein NRS6110_04127 [Bacillus subtilis]|nr:hypothetical protein BDW29_2296 [Bacillus sp. AtDRG31]WIT26995.1 hypothetical protein [Bacillus phage SPbetaL2]CAF1774211.1 hypothetical protein NRS6103_03987 [Bacillus subtilis]CAF1785120.1 hypothetical protein NRS6110_04127 [Bacillus subtilis]CAF1899650.1 hypothetical protein NRS6183_04047 [Bacillus subtilis]